ncbi:MAG: branched-chain-amino-acid transaminase [Gammaproteobacteria bacterium]|nr:branched-chain-amino-acid transaminase [Gammaproteobacteria bacterium]MBT7370929.1 branched-chain-amino-acid transaminase [Gammaproteobacteria bacterium]
MQTYSINGSLCTPEEAMIPVTDHGFLYGDGVFEGLRFYGKRILKFTAHLNRLVESASAIALPLPLSLEELRESVLKVVEASPLENGYVRLIITRGTGPLGIDPRSCDTGNVIIIAGELKMVSQTVRHQGARLIIASTRRLAADQLDSRIKSLNYLNQIMARIEANEAGADEAVVLNQAGFVAEGTADNIFIVKGGILLTPPVTDCALDGITRNIILDIADKLSIPAEEKSITPFDVFTADECFLTGTGAELIPVREVVGRHIRQAPGPIFQRIEKQFQIELQHDTLFC